MHDETLSHAEHPHHGGMMAGAALRAIDAGLRALQRLRNRIEVPVEEDEDARHGRSRRAGTLAAAIALELPVSPGAPPARSLRRRALTVLLCLLLGAGVGILLAYRGAAELLAARETMIEYQQEQIERGTRQEAVDLDIRSRQQNEIAVYRQRLRETQQEVDEQQSRIAQLDSELQAMKRVAQPAPRSAGGARAVPQKIGNCVTGPTSTPAQLRECIDKFNRP